MSSDRTSSGPPDFPFSPGDHVAVRAPNWQGDDAWFAGTVVALGTGGLRVHNPPSGLDLWVPWALAVTRNLHADEIADMEAATVAAHADDR